MAELNVMPLFTDAWTGDVSDLPNALYGAYTRLIVRWWREGAMPEENEKRLARWAGCASTEFEDLKEFLEKTEKGWIQRKLMKTYAQTLEKSLKAQKSANARHGKSERNEELDERICAGYAERMLSVIRNPESDVEEANASSHKKKKNKKRKGEGAANVPRETINFPLPDDLEILRAVERLRAKHGYPKLSSYLIYDGGCAIERYGEEFLIVADGKTKAELIDQRFGGDFNAILGKGRWKIVVRIAEAAPRTSTAA